MRQKLHQKMNGQPILGAFILCLVAVLSAGAWVYAADAQALSPFKQPALPEFEGSIVDDRSGQFTRRGPQTYWHEDNQGHGDHFWWTQNTQSGIENAARWSLGITEAGTYDLFVYIPPTHATSQNATSLIFHSGEMDRVYVNQSTYRNSWHRLGSFDFDGTGEDYIELTDETGEPDTKYEIAFDAVGYSQLEPEWEEKVTIALWESIRPWLDEKTAVFEAKFTEWLDEQKGKLLQQLADMLKGWIDQQCAGLSAALIFPLIAVVLWHRQRR